MIRLSLFAIAACIVASVASDRDVAYAQGTQAEPRLPSSGRILRVGKALHYGTIAAAARDARDGDIVEIEAGEYRGDVAVWTQRGLVIRGIGGLAVLAADGAAAEGKAIWVIRGDNVTVERVRFTGARVSDQNGAGIRHELGKLTVRECEFEDNESGILGGNHPEAELIVERSKFARNGAPNGSAHQLYVGTIRKLTVTESYFRLGRIGHLLKSRAQESDIRYNRLTDEVGGTSSYELEFPNGGRATAVGNLIQQSATTDNAAIVSYGAEGYKHPDNRLFLVHNTIVNDRPQGGVFVLVAPGASPALITNNILVGKGELRVAGIEPQVIGLNNNPTVGKEQFVQAVDQDYRLLATSPIVGTARTLLEPERAGLTPTREYVHPAGSRAIAPGTKLSPGAFQLSGPLKPVAPSR